MKLYFAPMEGITGHPFRNAHKKFFSGIDRYYTPFIVTNQHFSFQKKEMRDVEPEKNQGLNVVPQILSNQPEQFLHAVCILSVFGYPEVNLNLGCPSPTVVNRHRGAGMLRNPEELDRFLDVFFEKLEHMDEAMEQRMIRRCKKAEFHPETVRKTVISVKTRLGFSEPGEAKPLLQILNRYPIGEVVIHARLREDYYREPVRMEVFAEMYEGSRHPVCYNGDVRTPDEISRLKEAFPDLSAVMIGRGLLRNPALAREYRVPGSALSQEELYGFLNELYQNYALEMAGDGQVISRMKELWSYLKVQVPDSDKAFRKLRKAKSKSEYDAFLSEILPGSFRC